MAYQCIVYVFTNYSTVLEIFCNVSHIPKSQGVFPLFLLISVHCNTAYVSVLNLFMGRGQGFVCFTNSYQNFLFVTLLYWNEGTTFHKLNKFKGIPKHAYKICTKQIYHLESVQPLAISWLEFKFPKMLASK